MKPRQPLTPCLIGNGTVADHRDMVRALETLEGFSYAYVVDDAEVTSGRATLVKLMDDEESATMLVNGCLFLNVDSFRYLNFSVAEDGGCTFELVGDGSLLRLVPNDEVEIRTVGRPVLRLIDESVFDSQPYIGRDDLDEDE